MPIRRWRALALVGIHVLILIHLLHWWASGESLARFVLDDASISLQQGVINPGFLLLGLIVLATLVLGRFFCGWACHMAALQDACAWLMRRFGLNPRPFRARLLGYVPLTLALYLFVWPLFKRDWLNAWVQPYWPALAAWLGPVPSFQGWSLALTSRDLWAGLPPPTVAVPFLLLSGFVIVWFLGSRGLCRYGCPYGGIFQLASQTAVLTVMVNPGLCDGCARCTAACTVGVRAHEQAAFYGAVVDADCMRTLDCVEACPHQALTVRWTKPVVWRRLKSQAFHSSITYDLSWVEECLTAALMMLTIVVTRGLYGQIPFLLAVTLGAIVAYLILLGFRLIGRKRVLLGRRVLKNVSLTGHGWIWSVGIVLAGALLVHSLAVRMMLERATFVDRQINVPLELILQGGASSLPPIVHAQAETALAWYQRADSWRYGGMALARTPGLPLRRAWLHLLLDEQPLAEQILAVALEKNPQDAALKTALLQLRRFERVMENPAITRPQDFD